MNFFKLLRGVVKTDAWISLGCYMDLSKLKYVFLSVVVWICQNCYKDFSDLLHGCVKTDT